MVLSDFVLLYRKTIKNNFECKMHERERSVIFSYRNISTFNISII